MHGKKYKEAAAKYNKIDVYPLADSIKLVKEMAYAKFDETIEVAVRLNLNKSQSIRSTIALPNSFQKQKKILVFAKGEKVEEAKNAGAEYVGDDDLIAKIKDGWLDFDVAIATPDMMKDVGKLGPILGAPQAVDPKELQSHHPIPGSSISPPLEPPLLRQKRQPIERPTHSQP